MNLFKRHSTSTSATGPVCAHGVMIARWERLEDMGKEDRVSHFECESCHERFSPGEARAVAERNALQHAPTS